MTAPRLSVISVTRDDPAGVTRTLKSLQGWLVRDEVEHVVVYAGDAPPAEFSPRSRYLYRAPAGIADAFNAGLKETTGEWVWFVNGGDAVHERLDPAWMISLLAETAADVVTGACVFDGEETARIPPPLRYQWPLVSCWLLHPATLVRRRCLLEAGGFRDRWKIAMDFDLWHRVLAGDARVDVLSVTLARFDRRGVSEHPNSAPEAKREAARVILDRPLRLACAGAWVAARTLYRLSIAVVTRFRG